MCSNKKNKVISIVISLILVWTYLALFYNNMKTLTSSEDGVSNLIGAFSYWALIPMFLISLIQLLILFFEILNKNKRILSIICLILEIIYFLTFNFFGMAFYINFVMINNIINIFFVTLFELLNIFIIGCMINSLRRI